MYHIRAVVLPEGIEEDVWIRDGVITRQRVDGAVDLPGGFVLPGLVDAHCHIGLSPRGAVTRQEAEAQAWLDITAGVTLVRDAGVPTNTRWLEGSSRSPRIIRSGLHIARPMRYIKGFAVEVQPEDLVDQVRVEARAGDGWVKLVGDWIDRAVGDLEPLWPADVAAQAIEAAHSEGAKVTAHCFGERSVNELVRVGIDCIEHGCGLDEETMTFMAGQGVALVPTLDNYEIFPGIAAQADGKYPVYAAHMRDLYAKRKQTMAQAVGLGVPIYAGTDAGGTRGHGTIMAEITALAEVGGNDFALGAASWRAREWLGYPLLEDGAPADLVVCERDPRLDVAALADLSVVMIGGIIVS